MYTIALVEACLLCICHGLRKQQLASNHMPDSSHDERHNSQKPGDSYCFWLAELLQMQSEEQSGAPQPLKVFAELLLSLTPTTGFGIHATGFGRRLVMHSSSDYHITSCSDDLFRHKRRTQSKGSQGKLRRPYYRTRLHPVAMMRQNASAANDIALVAPLYTVERIPEQARASKNQTVNGNKSILELEKVVESLTADIPELLRREPNWDLYAPDFHVKSSLEGLGVWRVLSRLLEKRNESFVVKDDIQIDFVDGRTFKEPFDPFLVARWKIQLDRPFNKLEKGISMRDDALLVAAETVFQLNKNNQVAYVQIDNLVVDGRKILSWPRVDVFEDPAIVLKIIQEQIIDETDMPELEEEYLDLKKVTDTLKADIPKLLRKEPNWDTFANDFRVRTSLESLGILNLLKALLKRRNEKVVQSEDIQVEFNDGRWKIQRDGRPFDPCVVARWKVQFERPFNAFERSIRFLTRPLQQYYRNSTTFVIEAETTFHLNEKNKVDYVLIDKLVVDGRKIFSWPRVEFADDPAQFYQELTTWVDGPMFDPLKKLQEFAQNIKSIDLSASYVIRAWKSIAAVSKATAETEIACESTKNKIVKKMDGTQKILTQMADDIEWSSPNEILAIASNRNAESLDSDDPLTVLAIATIFYQTLFDPTGQLEELAETLGVKEVGEDLYTDGSVPVMEIGEITKYPTASAEGNVGSELLLRIVGRAAASGRLVVLTPANDQLERYYQKFGFEMIDDYGRRMVYSKPLEDVADSNFKFELVSLPLS